MVYTGTDGACGVHWERACGVHWGTRGTWCTLGTDLWCTLGFAFERRAKSPALVWAERVEPQMPGRKCRIAKARRATWLPWLPMDTNHKSSFHSPLLHPFRLLDVCGSDRFNHINSILFRSINCIECKCFPCPLHCPGVFSKMPTRTLIFYCKIRACALLFPTVTHIVRD